MEMWEAATNGVPILLLPVHGKGFDLEDTIALLGDLETILAALGGSWGGLAEISGHMWARWLKVHEKVNETRHP